jgi:hypothetical protein
VEKKFNCRPVASNLRDKKFLDMLVGRLSYYRAKSCAFELAIQKHSFGEAMVRGIIGRKLLLVQRLRKFKNLRR